MSWRAGSDLFLEILPSINQHVEKEIKKEFLTELIGVFSKYDVDIFELEGIDPLIDNILTPEDKSSTSIDNKPISDTYYYGRSENKEEFNSLKKLSDNDDSDAQFQLGLIYLRGKKYKRIERKHLS